jgi:hypothetical protein
VTDTDRAHTMAHQFAAEKGGDLTQQPVLGAARAALATFERELRKLRRARRLDNENYVLVLSQLHIVRDGLTDAAKPGLLVPPERCSCALAGMPSLRGGVTPDPDDDLRDAIRMVAHWTALDDPRADEAAAEWIQDAATQPGDVPDQLLCVATGLLAHAAAPGEPPLPDLVATDPDNTVAGQSVDGLLAAAGDDDAASRTDTTYRALALLRHPDPARHAHRRALALHALLTPLGVLVRDRARDTAHAFYQDGGGYLADPDVHRAAGAALNTYEMMLVGMHHTDRLAEDPYLALLGGLITVADDFAFAARFTAAPDTTG